MGSSPQDEERLLGTVNHLRKITRRYLCRIRINTACRSGGLLLGECRPQSREKDAGGGGTGERDSARRHTAHEYDWLPTDCRLIEVGRRRHRCIAAPSNPIPESLNDLP